MRLTRDVLLVGSGDTGFNISHPLDCHIYLLDGGDEFALIDAGIGGPTSETDQILANIEEDGIDPTRIGRLLLTHYHTDHAGGAADFRERIGCLVHGSPLCADVVTRADAEVTALTAAQEAGMYPRDYILQPCPAESSLTDGATFNVGRLQVTVFETPGHSADHISLLIEGGDRTYLIGGDLIFYGGTIVAQNIPDCSLQDYAESMIRMSGVQFDALLPGHFTPSLRDGKRHVDAAAAKFLSLGIPRNAV